MGNGIYKFHSWKYKMSQFFTTCKGFKIAEQSSLDYYSIVAYAILHAKEKIWLRKI